MDVFTKYYYAVLRRVVVKRGNWLRIACVIANPVCKEATQVLRTVNIPEVLRPRHTWPAITVTSLPNRRPAILVAVYPHSGGYPGKL